MENNLSLNDQAVAALRESAKWSLFLSIVGFIGIGFLLIAAAIVGFAMSRLEDVSPGIQFKSFYYNERFCECDICCYRNFVFFSYLLFV